MNSYVKDLQIRDFNDNRVITLNNVEMFNKNKKKKTNKTKKKSNKIKNEIINKL